jgi:hypothetical protein
VIDGLSIRRSTTEAVSRCRLVAVQLFLPFSRAVNCSGIVLRSPDDSERAETQLEKELEALASGDFHRKIKNRYADFLITLFGVAHHLCFSSQSF